SACGVRCDAVQQFDDCVGKITAALDKLNLAGNTLLIVTSDNGPVVDDGYADGSVEALDGHAPAGPLRGGKYSIYEGGTRVPFIARWPKRIKPGVSDALIGQYDFMASFAALTGRSLAEDAGPDSINVLPALLGESRQGRDHLVEHAQGLALRQGNWKLVAPTVPAGGGKKQAGKNAVRAPELYNLAGDVGETKDLAGQNPQLVREMLTRLEKIRSSGRSRP
ncbi:MAG: sulfatase-like hydrolase/transferase, partial [Acidobacteria bacterium]|nr:sulfatase-like hydrolase/transferase [Acidobacteriota bacterium]